MSRTRTVPDQAVPEDAKIRKNDQASDDLTKFHDVNTALNIALFPPLFFFSALFYTDVWSTLLVLLNYVVLLRKMTAFGGLFDDFAIIVVGVMALLFRQTNIFWVAVFPAGLVVIDALKTNAPPANSPKPTTFAETVHKGWADGIIHDCAVQDAGLPGARHFMYRYSNVWTNYC
jgi:alpha-1,2-glucosyltransferase